MKTYNVVLNISYEKEILGVEAENIEEAEKIAIKQFKKENPAFKKCGMWAEYLKEVI